MAAKHLSVVWVKGHSNNEQNNLADFAAKTSYTLSAPKPEQITAVGVFGYKGEEVKHIKPIIKQLIPTHNHTGIHSTSWTIRKKGYWDNRAWNWTFGIKGYPQFGNPQDSWELNCKKFRPCQVCEGSHDISVYGMISTCGSQEWSQLRDMLLKQWGPFCPAVNTWLKLRGKAGVQGWNDLLLFWRLLLPTNLEVHINAEITKVKKFYTQFVKAAIKGLVNKLGELPPPLHMSTVKSVSKKKNPHTWLDFPSQADKN